MNPFHNIFYKIASQKVSIKEAREIGASLGIDWNKVDVEEFRKGVEVEFEHGSQDSQTNVTNNDPLLTGRIAWAHLKEMKDYYTQLDRMEAQNDS